MIWLSISIVFGSKTLLVSSFLGGKSSSVSEVTIDSVAVLKIVKHCNDSLPTMVAGSLLGLDTNKTLEISYSYPFPQPKVETEKVDLPNMSIRQNVYDSKHYVRILGWI